MRLSDFPGDYDAKLDALQDHQERERHEAEQARIEHDVERAFHLAYSSQYRETQ